MLVNLQAKSSIVNNNYVQLRQIDSVHVEDLTIIKRRQSD